MHLSIIALATLTTAATFAPEMGSEVAMPEAALALTCPTLIQGDMNGDGICNVTDAVLFNAAYNAGQATADWNYDCVVNVADIAAFYNILGPKGVSQSTILDYNLDGSVDIADWVAYSADYNAGSSRANITKLYDGQGDCGTDIADFSLWSQWYTNGCQ